MRARRRTSAKSHAPKTKHRALTSSEHEMGVLCAIVETTAGFLSFDGADLFKGRALKPGPVSHDHIRPAMLAHWFSWEFQSDFLVSGLRDEAF